MEWRGWIGKDVFIRTKHGKVYSGKIKEIEQRDLLTWIFIVDKFGKNVMFVDSEITEIKEEEKRE